MIQINFKVTIYFDIYYTRIIKNIIYFVYVNFIFTHKNYSVLYFLSYNIIFLPSSLLITNGIKIKILLNKINFLLNFNIFVIIYITLLLCKLKKLFYVSKQSVANSEANTEKVASHRGVLRACTHALP